MLAFPAPPAARISSAAAPSRCWYSYTALQSRKPAGAGPRAPAAAGGVGFGSASAGAPTAVVASTATPVQTRARLSRLADVCPQWAMGSSSPSIAGAIRRHPNVAHRAGQTMGIRWEGGSGRRQDGAGAGLGVGEPDEPGEPGEPDEPAGDGERLSVGGGLRLFLMTWRLMDASVCPVPPTVMSSY